MISFNLGNGTILEIPEKEFLGFLLLLMQGYADLAEQYIQNHVAALADFDNVFYWEHLQIVRSQFATLDRVIDDEELLQNLHFLLTYLEKLENNDRNIVSEYAAYFDIKQRGKEIDRKKLKSKVKESRMQGDPIPDKVKSIRDESFSFLAPIQNLRKTISERINDLLKE